MREEKRIARQVEGYQQEQEDRANVKLAEVDFKDLEERFSP